MHYRAKLARIGATLDAVLLGSVISLLRANKTVRKKIQSSAPEHYDDDERLKHAVDDLDKALAASVDRLQRIEDKATRTVIGVGVAVAILGSATAILGGDGPLGTSGMSARVSAAALLMAGILFLLLSGYLALRAYAIGEVYLPTLHDAAPLASEQGAKKVLLYCIEQNERVGTLRANLLSASFACLRNGLVLVAVLGVVLVLSSFSASSAGVQPRFRADNAPHCRSNR
jgi:hypothetical protein